MAKLTQLIANFETQLASTINVGGVSGYLKTPVKDDDGVTLPNGLYIMAFNLGESNEEHLSFTLDATTGAMTNIKSISRQGVESVGAKKQHRTGSKASITDFANLLYISNILKGLDTLDGNNPLKYDTDPLIDDVKQLATKKYIDELALAGAPDASDSTKGIVEMAISSEIDSGAIAGETSAPLAITPAGLAGSKYNKFKSTPSATNKILTEDQIYTDGVSANQPLSNDSIKFGETDTAGKNNKIYQSFIAGKETIKSISFKKGNYPQIPINTANNLAYYSFDNILTDSLGKSGTLTGAGSVSFVSDAYGNANSARRYGDSGYGKDTGTLGTAITGAFILQTRFTSKSGGSGNASIAEVGDYTANNGFGIWINKTGNANGSTPNGAVNVRINQQYGGNNSGFATSYIPPIDVPVDYKFIYDGAKIYFYKREFGIDANWVKLIEYAYTTNPSSTTNFGIGCRRENTTEYTSGIVDYFAVANSATANIMEGEKVDSDVLVKIYADNAGVPDTGTTLSTITIPKGIYNSIIEDSEKEFALPSILDVDYLSTYWIEFSQITPSDTLYGNLAYQNTNQSGFTLKKWNTTDSFVAITGALYLKVVESYMGKIATMDNFYIDYFGDGSDGDVVISSNTTLTRDMYYNNLDIGNGNLITNDFKIYVKNNLSRSGSGKIHSDYYNTAGGKGNSGATFGTDGRGGGVVYVLAMNIISGSFSSIGENGLSSGLYSGQGGGGGGMIILIYKYIDSGSVTTSVVGGLGGNSGSNGYYNGVGETTTQKTLTQIKNDCNFNINIFNKLLLLNLPLYSKNGGAGGTARDGGHTAGYDGNIYKIQIT